MAYAATITRGIGDNNPPPLKDILAENYRELDFQIEDIADRANAAPKTVKSDADLDAIGIIVKDARAMSKRVDQARTTEKEPHLKAGREIDGFFKGLGERLVRIVTVLEARATEYQRAKAAEARRKAEEEARKLREAEEAARRKAEEAAAAGKARMADRAEIKADTAAEKAAEAERIAQASAADLARTRGASGTLASAKTVQKVRINDMAALDLNQLKPYIDREAVQKAANAWLRVTKGKETISGLEVYEDVTATFR